MTPRLMEDRTICITGGASGIGRATALAAAAMGARIAIIDLRASDIDAAVNELQAQGVEAAGYALDVRDARALAQAADQFEAKLGPVNGLLTCAGISATAPAESFQEDDFSNVIDINLKGTFLACREFGGRMIKRQSGSIVLVASVNGLGGHAGRISYVSSKHGVMGLVRNLAIEWGRHGVRVNGIAPGFVETPLLLGSIPPGFISDILDRTPLGRMAQPQEIANIALMLLSEQASYVTGTTVPIDGGLTAGFFTRQQGGDYASRRLLEAGLYSE